MQVAEADGGIGSDERSGSETEPTADSTATDEASATPSPEPTAAGLAMMFPLAVGDDPNVPGGDIKAFKRASNPRSAGGRISSYFDHQYPMYGAESGEDAGASTAVLGAFGEASDLPYSGHPGYDLSIYDEAHRTTTPVFAAADGTLRRAEWHSASGWHVEIEHDVPEVGRFVTVYMHMCCGGGPDEHFRATQARVGETVRAGERIGTMGTTGNSSGEHLHFEVRFDHDTDGRFNWSSSGYNVEAVDPYGFTPTGAFPNDPWASGGRPPSNYLWRHRIRMIARALDDGSGAAGIDIGGGGGPASESELRRDAAGEKDAPLGLICAEPGTLPPNGTVHYSWAPDPPHEDDRIGVGEGFVVSAFGPDGEPATEFDPPLAVEVGFEPEDIVDVDPESLAIYQEADSSDGKSGSADDDSSWLSFFARPAHAQGEGRRWIRLDTYVDLERGIARAEFDRPGRGALMGRPIRDVVMPRTVIGLSGDSAGDGLYFGPVLVTIDAQDGGGITQLMVRVDGEDEWRPYDGPFTVDPEGFPEDALPRRGEGFRFGPGRHRVLAYAVDSAGNREDPPVEVRFDIDERLAPGEVGEKARQAYEAGVPGTATAAAATATVSATLGIAATEAAHGPEWMRDGASRPTEEAEEPGEIEDVEGTEAPEVGATEVATGGTAAPGTTPRVAGPDAVATSQPARTSVAAAPPTRIAPVTFTPKPRSARETPVPTLSIPAPPTSATTRAAAPSATAGRTAPTPRPTVVPVDRRPPPALPLLKPGPNANIACGSVRIVWSPPSTVAEPDGVSGYERLVELSDGGPGDAYRTLRSSRLGPASEQETLSGLDCGAWYRWRVRAIDVADNVGAWSEGRLFQLGEKSSPPDDPYPGPYPGP